MTEASVLSSEEVGIIESVVRDVFTEEEGLLFRDGWIETHEQGYWVDIGENEGVGFRFSGYCCIVGALGMVRFAMMAPTGWEAAQRQGVIEPRIGWVRQLWSADQAGALEQLIGLYDAHYDDGDVVALDAIGEVALSALGCQVDRE